MLARIISDCGFATYDFDHWRMLVDSRQLRAEAQRPGNERWLMRLKLLSACIQDGYGAFYSARAAMSGDYERLRGWFQGQHPGDMLGVLCRDIIGIISDYMWFYASRCFHGGCQCRTFFLGNYAVHGDRPSDVFINGQNGEFSWASGDRPRSYRVTHKAVGGTTYSVVDPRPGVVHDPDDVRKECLRLMDVYQKMR